MDFWENNLDKELREAYYDVLRKWGNKTGDGSDELTTAFADEVLNRLPEIDTGLLARCTEAASFFIIFDKGKMPSRLEIKAKLNKFIEDCMAMEEAFDSMDPFILFVLQRGYSLDPNRSDNSPVFNVRTFIAAFKAFSESAKAYTEDYLAPLPLKGPSKDWATDNLIIILAGAFEATTQLPAKRFVNADANHKGFHGEFFELVLGCTQALGKRYHSNDALGDRIRRVLNKRAKQA